MNHSLSSALRRSSAPCGARLLSGCSLVLTVATLALLAHPASASGLALPPIGDFHLPMPPMVSTQLGDIDKDPYVIINGKPVFIFLPPTQVGDGKLTIGQQVPSGLVAVYQRPDGSLEVIINGPNGNVSFIFDFKDGGYYFHGNAIVDGKNEFHIGVFIGERGSAGFFGQSEGDYWKVGLEGGYAF